MTCSRCRKPFEATGYKTCDPCREHDRERKRRMYATDAGYRERKLERDRAAQPAKTLYQRERYNSDPEYAERRRASTRRKGGPVWAALEARDGAGCFYCGGEADSIDHYWPRTGGEPTLQRMDELPNLRLACRPCNSRKGRMAPHEFEAVRV